MPKLRPFLTGFPLGLLLFIFANLLAAHFRSDCGILAILGRSACADDIRRAGFPLLFYEEGGFAYRHVFNAGALAVDGMVGLAMAVAAGSWVARRR